MAPADFDEDGKEAGTEEEGVKKRPVSLPEVLPILPLRNVVLYPHMVVPITVGQPRSLRLIEQSASGDRIIGIVAMKNPTENEPNPESLYHIGAVAQILRLMRAPDGNIHILVQGLEKIAIEAWVAESPFLRAKIKILNETIPGTEDREAEALRLDMVELFKRQVAITSNMPDDLVRSVSKTRNLRHLAYLIGSSIRLDLATAQQLLEMDDVTEKMRRLTDIIRRELEVLELGKKIRTEAKSEMDKAQREYFLRQQLKAIQRELGEENEDQLKVNEFRKKVESLGMSEEARKEALREISRMEKIPEASAEYGVILTYLDWITSLPWDEESDDILDMDSARQILDEDHYGLDKIKDRILEYLAVRKLRGDRVKEREEIPSHDQIRREREGVILCFVGPPGLGKTSLGQSIARALGRKFHRISLGGIRDEAEIRGHRRTYIGAMPGRFIQALRRVGTKNPLILLDEVDKIGADWRGDPSAALLEVLDPEQNRDFRDHYLDVNFDLSKVMFIATANVLDTIPRPLQDRLEILTLSGYTDGEKLNIAQQYLLARQIRENGLMPGELTISDEAINKIIHDYTREPGVRALERKIGGICRKIAIKIATRDILTADVGAEDLIELLGKPAYAYDMGERSETPGIATGLAVTYAGGDLLFVEVTKMPGKKNLTVTGQLGEVMKESVEAAVSYVRSQAETLGFERDFFESHDLHVHIPAGATPKDGPSAGVTVATALTSLLTGRGVDKTVGMTGEITLRGQVLAVGGIKDKVLAAYRAGLKTVILPTRNERDLDDLPKAARESMSFILADHVDIVLKNALLDRPN